VEQTQSVTIGHEGATLRFHTDDPVGQSFVVTLDAPGITASQVVSLGHYLQGDELVEFFGGLAKDWKGWDGPREWFGNGDLRLICWHDRIGHVTVQFELGQDPVHEWHEPAWKVTGQVIVDPGALVAITDALGHMFDGG
jgi:hypothetical protein